MSADIPTARIPSVWQALLEFAVKAVTVSLALGLGYAVANAGCRNDAITYAHEMYPEAHCTAIHTSWFGESNDTAVCRVGERTFECVAPSSRSIEHLGCSGDWR